MKSPGSSRIGLALLFAAAIIAAAGIFKGNPTGTWVEAALAGMALNFVVLRRPACSR